MAKFLVVRFSSIGDIVLTSPVVRCLKEQVEGAEVHFLTKKPFLGLLESNPHIDQVHSINSSVFEISDELKNVGFDYIIDLHNNLRSRQLKTMLKIMSFDFPKHNWEKWLLVNFKVNRMPKRHIVECYFDSVQAFQVKNDGKGLDYFIPESEELNPREEWGISNYVAYGIGGNHIGKILPEEKIIATLGLLVSKGKSVILLGGPEDQARGERIRAPFGDEVINACGSLSLHGSASVVRQAEAVIAHDTAIMHIASAFQKTVISIWGCTVPEFGMSPYLPGFDSKMIQVEGLRSRPCSKLGKGLCKGFECMNGISEQAIADSI